jgi:murein L,D-transpeptidase YcbB/YkuD
VEASEFKYWLRQKKMNNALGVVKFLFPNDHSVYLHDTQSKRLFNKKVRAYSHGCIRVQNPQLLAQILVDNYYSEEQDISKIIRAKERKSFDLNESVNVYIRYYSCTVDDKGSITFLPDIYSKDEMAINTLFKGTYWN